jgi:hypothetical protein
MKIQDMQQSHAQAVTRGRWECEAKTKSAGLDNLEGLLSMSCTIAATEL